VRIYMYQADLYCGPCGEAIATRLTPPDDLEREYPDSNSYPIGFDSSEGESDTPYHCGNASCQLFLERRLTSFGYEYLRDAIRDRDDRMGHATRVVNEWAEYYLED
jgi:hypothetical protein